MLQIVPSIPKVSPVLLALLFYFIVPLGYALQSPVSTGSTLQHDYDAAQNAQAKGDLAQATGDYKIFIVRALNALGNDFAHTGDYPDANDAFDEGLLLEPENVQLRLDYAQAAVAAGDLPKAQRLAIEAVDRAPRDASARLALGNILLLRKQNQQAKKQLQIAVALNANYPDGLALARVYLALNNDNEAATIFAEMLKGFGDSAQIHMDFGLAYAETGHTDKAIAEFKSAIAKNDRLKGAHYSLGAAYIQSMGEIEFPLAEAEFKKEIALHPGDFLSYSQLGYIALAQRRFQDADRYLSKAVTINPLDPDVYLSLGQLYADKKEIKKAEAALKQSIVLTHDVSHNHYQVQRAHYLLGRLLLEEGKVAEAKQQMQISETLMREIVRQTQNKSDVAGFKAIPPRDAELQITSSREEGPAIDEVKAYKKKIGPAIADSYNNLGAIAASRGNFSESVSYFTDAAAWNPQLPSIDYNLGKAAYLAKQYSVAVAPLMRYVHAHPQDSQARLWLAVSLFANHDYKTVLEVIDGLDGGTGSSQQATFLYAESLVRTGRYNEGIRQLKLLGKSNPQSSAIHQAIGIAEVHHEDFSAGADELQKAHRLDLNDRQTTYDLAVAYIGLKENQQAQALLEGLFQTSAADFNVDSNLGRLLILQGQFHRAIAPLESAEKIDPQDTTIHRELATVYRRDSRLKDAKREARLSKRAKNSSEFGRGFVMTH